MNRTILFTLVFTVAASLGEQGMSQSDPYRGTSNPPANDEYTTTAAPQAKPAAGHPVVYGAAQGQAAQQSTTNYLSNGYANSGNDDGIIQNRPQAPAPRQPMLSERSYAYDPDGDIVHPHTRIPGELGEGTTIRVRLLNRLSTASSEKGEVFRSKVASDVLQGGQVLIPTGAEIDGQVVEVSSGHVGGHGTMRLRPETLILLDGSRFRLSAETSGTPGSKTRVGSEGTIKPDSRAKRDSIEYGSAVGAGVITGAIVAGPAGVLAGGLIGAGVVTAHLLVSHPQAVLEAGTVMLFTLSEPLSLVPTNRNGN